MYTHRVCVETICEQAKIIGTCTSWVRRYWKNPATGECEQFQYSGCGGNDNNFKTQLACQTACRDTTGTSRRAVVYIVTLLQPSRNVYRDCRTRTASASTIRVRARRPPPARNVQPITNATSMATCGDVVQFAVRRHPLA